MAWYWSDDVARAAIAAGLVSEPEIRGWIDRPVAHAAAEALTALDAAVALGLGQEASAGAA